MLLMKASFEIRGLIENVKSVLLFLCNFLLKEWALVMLQSNFVNIVT